MVTSAYSQVTAPQLKVHQYRVSCMSHFICKITASTIVQLDIECHEYVALKDHDRVQSLTRQVLKGQMLGWQLAP